MELDEIFSALRDAVQVLHSHPIKFTETPMDEDGNELEKKTTTMDLGTFVIRSFGETLIHYGKTKEEIEDALKTDESDEVPTGNPWTIVLSRFGGKGKTRKNKTKKSKSSLK